MKAKLRSDLKDYVFTTPYGESIDHNIAYKARWSGDVFQLLVDGEWHEFDSIDFELEETPMTMMEQVTFDNYVHGYINDNKEFINPLTPENALQHNLDTREAFNEPTLTEEQKERFKFVAFYTLYF